MTQAQAATNGANPIRTLLLHIAGSGLEADDMADLAVRELSKRAPANDDTTTAITKLWRPLEASYLREEPPPRRWLLRHPTRDGKPCPAGAGDGLLPMGKVGFLVSEGGVGKTNVLLQLGIAIPTGRRWVDHFDIGYDARPGKIFLGLAEEDAEEVWRRLWNAAEASALSNPERELLLQRLVVVPFAGHPVSLLQRASDGKTLIESADLIALRQLLVDNAGEQGWALVVLDPLARWAGIPIEGDNFEATRLVQAAETLTVVPGNPAVLVTHHSSKFARRMGSVDARGVTGTTDAARWVATLRAEGASVYFMQSKSNYSRPMFEEIGLVRGQGGLLRAPTDAEASSKACAEDEAATAKDLKKATAQEKRIADLEIALVKALRSTKEPVPSRSVWAGLVIGGNAEKHAAMTRLLTVDPVRVRKDGSGFSEVKS